jgi:hypothetical protein
VSSDTEFYASIKGFDHFHDLTKPTHFHPAPFGWYAIISDIRGSTKAIQQGRYKEVNMVGAGAIMAVLNSCKTLDLPYAFGGDGATLLVPASALDKVMRAIRAVQANVQQMFDLELRAGCVQLKHLYEQGAKLRVGRYYLSSNISQAVFQGDALTLAEDWLKNGHEHVVLCEPKADDSIDLSGLECRWEPIENRNGCMLSLLARATADKPENAMITYGKILADIAKLYPDMKDANPVHIKRLRISLSPKRLQAEVKMRAGASWWARQIYLLRILLLNSIGRFSFATGRKPLGFDGKRYLSELVENSDVQKFDEMLRMVIDSSQEQYDYLQALLESYHQQGRIVYGLHHSSHALMTCLVFNLKERHIHFIDGSDGGYAVAALQMKSQLSHLQQEKFHAKQQ